MLKEFEKYTARCHYTLHRLHMGKRFQLPDVVTLQCDFRITESTEYQPAVCPGKNRIIGFRSACSHWPRETLMQSGTLNGSRRVSLFPTVRQSCRMSDCIYLSAHRHNQGYEDIPVKHLRKMEQAYRTKSLGLYFIIQDRYTLSGKTYRRTFGSANCYKYQGVQNQSKDALVHVKEGTIHYIEELPACSKHIFSIFKWRNAGSTE